MTNFLVSDTGIEVAGQFIPANIAATVSALASQIAPGTRQIVCWGDSLTEGSGSAGNGYPLQLSAATGRVVVNLGRGSQKAEEIAARAGGLGALVTVSGNLIPSYGSVNVTTITIPMMQYAGGAWSLPGTLAGVAGRLCEDGSGGYSFLRDVDGAPVRCWPGTPFLPSLGALPWSLPIIWLGRNDYSAATTAQGFADANARIMGAVQSIVDSLQVTDKRFVVLGVTAKDTPIEYTGAAGFTAKRDLAAMMARRWSRSFIDIDVILRESGTGTGDDVTDYANGIIPRSLRAPGDPTHFTAATYGIVAQEVARLITARGW